MVANKRWRWVASGETANSIGVGTISRNFACNSRADHVKDARHKAAEKSGGIGNQGGRGRASAGGGHKVRVRHIKGHKPPEGKRRRRRRWLARGEARRGGDPGRGGRVGRARALRPHEIPSHAVDRKVTLFWIAAGDYSDSDCMGNCGKREKRSSH